MKRLEEFVFGPLQVFRLVTGPIEENCYVLRNQSGQALIVDPGEDAAQILELLRSSQSQAKAILLTHAHFDHIGAVEVLRRTLTLPVYLHREAGPQYAQAHLAAARWGIPFEQPGPPDAWLELGVHDLAEMQLEARLTPGHAPGHLSFVWHGNPSSPGFVLSGDALFRGSIGRTDLPGCDHAQLLRSIRQELLSLPDPVVVFAGHGPETTIAAERKSNPYLTH